MIIYEIKRNKMLKLFNVIIIKNKCLVVWITKLYLIIYDDFSNDDILKYIGSGEWDEIIYKTIWKSKEFMIL